MMHCYVHTVMNKVLFIMGAHVCAICSFNPTHHFKSLRARRGHPVGRLRAQTLRRADCSEVTELEHRRQSGFRNENRCYSDCVRLGLSVSDGSP
jgi:hypothetical protein